MNCMKRGLILLCMFVLLFPWTVQAEESKRPVAPLPLTIDTAAIQETESATFAAGFSISDFYVEEDGTPCVWIDIYERELFDMVDVSLLEEGDTIVLGGDRVTVETLERGEKGSLIINGGLESDGGHVLLTDEDTVYYEVNEDGIPNYLEAGEAAIALVENFILVDYSGNEETGIEYDLEKVFEYEDAGILNLSFTPEDTEVTVENGLVTNITRIALDMEPDTESDTDTAIEEK